jgi:hypothetical protein
MAILTWAREKACPAQKCRPAPNARFTVRGAGAAPGLAGRYRKMSKRSGSENLASSLLAEETSDWAPG